VFGSARSRVAVQDGQTIRQTGTQQLIGRKSWNFHTHPVGLFEALVRSDAVEFRKSD